MNDKQLIMEYLTFWYAIFITLFVMFGVVMCVLTARIFTEVRAFNQCSSVEDRDFKACYESHK